MKIYCIAKILDNEHKIIEHNGNTYKSLDTAITGNLCEQDVVKIMYLDEAVEEEEGVTTYYYVVILENKVK
jgi:hypothetical protein